MVEINQKFLPIGVGMPSPVRAQAIWNGVSPARKSASLRRTTEAWVSSITRPPFSPSESKVSMFC